MTFDAKTFKESIRRGDILVEKYKLTKGGHREVVSIYLVLNRHMESEPMVDGYERTLFYKTYLMYVNTRQWSSGEKNLVGTIYYLSEHEISDHHNWEKLFESGLSWNDSYPRT